MAEYIDMGEPVVRLKQLGQEHGFCTDYFENYISELVDAINSLTLRVDALENP